MSSLVVVVHEACAAGDGARVRERLGVVGGRVFAVSLHDEGAAGIGDVHALVADGLATRLEALAGIDRKPSLTARCLISSHFASTASWGGRRQSWKRLTTVIGRVTRPYSWDLYAPNRELATFQITDAFSWMLRPTDWMMSSEFIFVRETVWDSGGVLDNVTIRHGFAEGEADQCTSRQNAVSSPLKTWHLPEGFVLNTPRSVSQERRFWCQPARLYSGRRYAAFAMRHRSGEQGRALITRQSPILWGIAEFGLQIRRVAIYYYSNTIFNTFRKLEQ